MRLYGDAARLRPVQFGVYFCKTLEKDPVGEAKIRYQLSVAEAAQRLGLSEGAIRQRIRRGTLLVRRKNRRLYVVLGEQDLADLGIPEPDSRQADPNATRTVQDAAAPADPTDLVSELDSGPVQADTQATPVQDASEPTVPREELDRVRVAYDELAEAWARDLRHQLARLEREVDRLQGELSEMRKRHAEEMRRKDILLQGNQEALSAWISHMTGAPRVLPPSEGTER